MTSCNIGEDGGRHPECHLGRWRRPFYQLVTRGFAFNNSNPLSKIHSVMKAEVVAPTHNIIGNGDDIRFISWVRGIAYNNSNPQPTIHSQQLLLLNLVQGWKYK